MKRYRIVLMVAQAQEVVVADLQEAHNEATKLASATVLGDIKSIVQSIEFVSDVQTEEINFGNDLDMNPEDGGS